MPTLILSPRQTEDAQLLWRAAIRAGWAIERAFGWKSPAKPEDDFTIYGEPVFVQAIAESCDVKVVVPTDDWLATLPLRWSGRNVKLMSLEDARLIGVSRFIKPCSDKEFAAGLYGKGRSLPDEQLLPNDLPVLVQEPVSWETEFRCFVVNRQVKTCSVYARGGELAQAEDGAWPASEQEVTQAVRICEAVCADADVALPVAVVVDVGLIAGRGWAVVECNAVTSSGIYGCDPAKVLEVLKHGLAL
ncbi:ATP-grasp domain-containing protein [Synoicihabitans lomoniglobus]|uniref:ATP-grasp domain-containing protein n=2 Tax=Synoicihabitans lomoniglobus TaxID=2909285 RepID=A0AAE9ZTW6_9BACT|nr:ATP-grasp domain-containing protein [Opitutaceae bacterium LMO-M01]